MPRLRQGTTVGTAGTASVVFRPRGSETWRVTQVSVDAPTVPGSSSCGLYVNSSLICPLVPNADAAGGDPPVELGNTDELEVRWEGATSGNVVNVLIFYDIIGRR